MSVLSPADTDDAMDYQTFLYAVAAVGVLVFLCLLGGLVFWNRRVSEIRASVSAPRAGGR